MSDPQRQKAYRFGWSVGTGPTLELDDIRKLYARVWAELQLAERFGMAAPLVQLKGTSKGISYYQLSRHLIVLANGWGQSTRVALHELAHAITEAEDVSEKRPGSWNTIKPVSERKDPGHGPRFMKWQLELFVRYLPGSLNRTELLCRAWEQGCTVEETRVRVDDLAKPSDNSPLVDYQRDVLLSLVTGSHANLRRL